MATREEKSAEIRESLIQLSAQIIGWGVPSLDEATTMEADLLRMAQRLDPRDLRFPARIGAP